MSGCGPVIEQSYSVNDETAWSRVAKDASSDRSSSTSSQISGASSEVYSMESGGCDSLTRAFQELGLREIVAELESANHIGGWMERSCSQTIGEAEDADEAFHPEAMKAGHENEVEQETWESRAAIKRCSSLRSNCSTDSVGSEGGRRVKKAVRFADSLGLDLIKVRHVFNFESPPETEPALRRLGCRRDSLAPAPPGQSMRRLLVSPCFPQPGGCAGFVSRVMSQKVMLERAGVEPGGSVLSGQIRVCNLFFEKRVTVRISFDSWRSCGEVAGVYEASDTAADMTDQFVFRVPLPAGFGASAGDRIALCVRYDTAGQTFWDSNYGENYAFDCLPLGWENAEDSLARFS